jgi:hypothetical protein
MLHYTKQLAIDDWMLSPHLIYRKDALWGMSNAPTKCCFP